MATFYVARPLDPITETPGDLFRVRILTIATNVEVANHDAVQRKNKGQTDVIVVTDEWKSRIIPRILRQIITAKVGTGEPGAPRFTTWA